MTKNKIWKILFVLYCAMMLWLLFHRTGYVEGIPYRDQLKYNLLPFETISHFLRLLHYPASRRHAIINLVGNVIMFIPLGALLPRVFPKLNRLHKVLLTTGVIMILVELAQLFTLLGSCDTDDLLLNVFGAAIGYWLHLILRKKRLS